MAPVVSAAQVVGGAVMFGDKHEGGFRAILVKISARAAASGHPLDAEVVRSTPKRYLRAMEEMTAGYDEDPREILSTVFDGPSDLVMLRGVRFQSLCEHHALPFTGTAMVAYLPRGGRIAGLSKLARLVDCFARRLQVQERMTSQIAEALVSEPLCAEGAAVVVRGRHACVECRGVGKIGAEMVTSSMVGRFRDDPALRAEVMRLEGCHD